MRTSGSCRRSKRPGMTALRGFSLLEMLVVLTLVSIMVALIAPRLANTVRAISTSGDRAETRRQLERLPLLARADGRAIVVEADEPVVREGFELPDGWKVTALTRLVVAANGVCRPTRLRVEGAGAAEEWALGTPDCRVGDSD